MSASVRHTPGDVCNISHSKIQRNAQHYRVNSAEDPAVKALAESMEGRYRHVHPITVYAEGGLFHLVKGERRFLAAELLGWDVIPCRIVEKSDGLLISLKQNMHRESLTPIERADLFKRVMAELNYSQRKLAGLIGLTEGAVSNVLSLVKLPEDIKTTLRNERCKIPLGKLMKLTRVENTGVQKVDFMELKSMYQDDPEAGYPPVPTERPPKVKKASSSGTTITAIRVKKRLVQAFHDLGKYFRTEQPKTEEEQKQIEEIRDILQKIYQQHKEFILGLEEDSQETEAKEGLDEIKEYMMG